VAEWSAADGLLELLARTPPGAWMSASCECCALSGRGLRDEPISRLGKSYRQWCVIVCDLETWRMKPPLPALGCCTRGGGGGEIRRRWPLLSLGKDECWDSCSWRKCPAIVTEHSTNFGDTQYTVWTTALFVSITVSQPQFAERIFGHAELPTTGNQPNVQFQWSRL
jgi:hypothetical protein